jgi:S1-C subfamily serine protease
MADFHQTVSRRRLLQTAAVSLAGGLAGCPATNSDAGSDTATPTERETATTTPTATETPTPPGIEQRVVQRDRGAILYVAATVSGRVSIPRFDTISPLAAGLVGSWRNRHSDEILEISHNRVFSSRGTPTSVAGTYTLRPGSLRFEFESGESAAFGYAVDTRQSPATLRLFQNDEQFAVYDRDGDGPDLGAVAVVRTFAFYRATGERAGVDHRTVQTGSTGSGFVVSPDGDIVTDARIVASDRDPDRRLLRYLADQSAATLRQRIRENVVDGVTDTELREIQRVVSEKLPGYYAEHASLSNVTGDLRVLPGGSGSDDGRPHHWSATVETADTTDATSQAGDVAVLSVDGSTLPTVTVDSTDDLSTGDDLLVVGYPERAAADVFDGSPASLEPTLTRGVVRGRRTLESGLSLIQTDVPVHDGNRGGPVYDVDGTVVALAVSGPGDGDARQTGVGLPSGVVSEYLQRLGVENRSTDLDAAFEAGLDAYWQGDCETATARMESVLDTYPEHPSARTYLDECDGDTRDR